MFAVCASAHAAFRTGGGYAWRVSTLNAAGTSVVSNYSVESNDSEAVAPVFDPTTNTWKSVKFSSSFYVDFTGRQIDLNTSQIADDLEGEGLATKLYADTVAAAAGDAAVAEIEGTLATEYTNPANGTAANVVVYGN